MKTVFTIDVGGTAIKYAIIDEELNITCKGEIPTPQDGYAIFLNTLEKLACEKGNDAAGISISLPGVIDSDQGVVQTGGWLTFNAGHTLALDLEERTGKPVYIENDGKCALLAESWKGSLMNVENGAVVILGTGLGGGLLLNGKLYKGNRFFAGEFSFVNQQMEEFGEKSYLAGFTCSTNGLIKMAEQVTGRTGLDGRKIFAAVSEGDTAMADVVRRFSKRIAIFIFNLNTLLDLDKVAIGGGISRQAILLEMIREETEKLYTHPMYTGLFPAARAPEIVQCRYFNDSNMVGAMYHFLIRERHEEAL